MERKEANVPISDKTSESLTDSREINNLSLEVRRKIETIMRVNAAGETFTAYETDYTENLHHDNNLTFLISPEPFTLPDNLRFELEKYGQSITAFYKTCDAIFRTLPQGGKWKEILTHNRPEWMLKKAESEGSKPSHLFLRPDFILTDNGVVTTEIETSPFGLALSLFLGREYPESLKSNFKLVHLFIEEILKGDKNKRLCFLLTDHTKKYKGQFEYLALLLREEGIDVAVALPDDINQQQEEFFVNGQKIDVLYRGFYLHETVDNEKLSTILQSNLDVYPGCKSHLEEKAIMAMLFDPDLEDVLRDNLGEHFSTLQAIFPPTYILKDTPPATLGIKEWQDLSQIPRKKRNFILKVSGFSNIGSWAKGVTFLNQLSQEQCSQAIEAALANPSIFVIQAFRKGKKFEQEYYDFENSIIQTMLGKVRLTPYYHVDTGELLTAKTTMCSNTDFIHASTNSINSPIK